MLTNFKERIGCKCKEAESNENTQSQGDACTQNTAGGQLTERMGGSNHQLLGPHHHYHQSAHQPSSTHTRTETTNYWKAKTASGREQEREDRETPGIAGTITSKERKRREERTGAGSGGQTAKARRTVKGSHDGQL